MGNKTDLNEKREVTQRDIQEEQEKQYQGINIHWAEASAKVGYKVKDLFQDIAKALPREDEDKPPPGSRSNPLEPPCL